MTTRRNMLAMSGFAVAGSAVAASGQGTADRSKSNAKITQIRNATLRIDYGGVRFLTRAELRAFADEQGFSDKLLTPGDGETIVL